MSNCWNYKQIYVDGLLAPLNPPYPHHHHSSNLSETCGVPSDTPAAPARSSSVSAVHLITDAACQSQRGRGYKAPELWSAFIWLRKPLNSTGDKALTGNKLMMSERVREGDGGEEWGGAQGRWSYERLTFVG